MRISRNNIHDGMFMQNDYTEFIKNFSIGKEKHIPHKYLLLSSRNRLELLAGLMDSDGSLSCNGYDFINKSKNISESVLFLARSVGLAAYINKSIKGIKSLDFKGVYWRVSITGNTSIIPCKISRKKAYKRKQKKNPLVTGFKVKKLYEDNYYGFELDGNHLYCMGDFTVTHNTGKRIQAVGLSQAYERTLFMCHREELIEQAYEDFNQMYPLQVGIVKGKRFEIENKIVIASVQTLANRLGKIPEDYFDCVIADEVHHFLAPTYRKSLEHFTECQRFGFTATPTRLDGLNFTDIFDQISFEYSIEQGINEGWLCSLEAYRVKTDVDIAGVKRSMGDFNVNELASKVDIPERNKLVVNKYQQYGAKRQGVVFCANIAHAINVKKAFVEAGITCETVHSNLDSEDRKSINRRFKNKDIQVLTNVNILTEGWDYSDIGIVMMARPTESLALYMQMIGRGTRLKSEEYRNVFERKDCTIVDFVDNFGQHRLINHWTIERDVPMEDRVLISEEQRDYYVDKIKEVREARIKRMTKESGKFDLFNMPNRRSIKHVGRLNEPATEKQLAWIKSEGIWIEGAGYTKGQASEFITNLPAKDWMIRQLQKWKYDTAGLITVGQYYEVKRDMN
jgi:superfamily II DNA or RNA helicase